MTRSAPGSKPAGSAEKSNSAPDSSNRGAEFDISADGGTGGGARPSVDRLVRDAARDLAQAGVPSPRVDAELLLAHAAGTARDAVRHAALLGRDLGSLATAGGPSPDDVVARLAALVARRAAREPLQHLTGLAPFRHLELAVGPGVFVPRPETEEVARVAIDESAAVVRRTGTALVADLCTGSGAVALAVATEVPGTVVHAVELDAAAHGWARRNVDAVAARTGARVALVRGDARTALRGLDGRCDVVVSNPPYVPPDAVPRDPEVAHHDPAVALYGLGADGLEVPRGVAAAAARLLRPGGLLVMEHAEVQSAAARRLVADAGFVDVATVADLTGRDRMVVARRGRPAGPAGADPRAASVED
ncbi:peptide chain release factor N(5)-glutamine methyltransferase [Cellulomonas sp. PhB143]|uniref:peptide chain release factor N(5)-glutamine methyltransferase n=1 Tax=Cellulomonas sp. PhB143 TaxID=2485186 RepID=UPI000F486EDD|nr:peptide chain release factor N(5)-glutamine methyltransferase [Cellulomonas sp. PhB143]ROS78476.1 release factor glutamine methyltransferase [Cellulomonas sp. PhB143]